MATKKTVIKKKKARAKVAIVRLCLDANFNNSLVTLTDLEGKVISWSSSGKAGFKGSKKSTPFATQKATEEVLAVCKEIEANTVHLVVKGAGQGRDSFLRSIQGTDMQIASIKDVTGFPFGGVRKRQAKKI